MDMIDNEASSERGFEVKLPTIWTDGKAEVGRLRDEKESMEKKTKKSEETRSKRAKKDAFHRIVFPMIVAAEGRKAGSLKRR